MNDMSVAPSRTLTLEQAAKHAGVSRWTVSRALQAGRLLGLRDNRGRWRVDLTALDAWAAEQTRTVLHPVQAALHSEQHCAEEQADGTLHDVQIAVLRTRLDLAEVRMGELTRERDEAQADARAQRELLAAARAREEPAQARALAAEADRDAWRAQAERLAARSAEPARRGWWPWGRT
jgi:excisionase family DNA binding protein